MYKWLFFDLDGTLLDYRLCERNALKLTLSGYFSPDSFESIQVTYHGINLALWEEVERGVLTAETLKTKRFAMLFESFHRTDIDPENIGRNYLDNLSMQAEPMPDVLYVLDELVRNYKLGIITNGVVHVQENRIRLSGLNKYFFPIVISLLYGISKPDKRIFNLALEKAGAYKEDTLFIGDSITSDMAGASNAGLDFGWFNPDCMEKPEQYPCKFVFHRFKTLLSILQENVRTD